MNFDSHPYPFSYYKGKATAFTRSDQFTSSYFGGPCDPNGDAAESTYDALNRTSTLVGTAGSSAGLYSYAYDAAGNAKQVNETYPTTVLNRTKVQ